MLDQLPQEVFTWITSTLAQPDKVKLTYVSRKSYHKVLPSLYSKLYLNDSYHLPNCVNGGSGTMEWSILYYSYPIQERDRHQAVREPNPERTTVNRKLACLIRSLRDNSSNLVPLITHIHCSWHLHGRYLQQLIELLIEHGTNFRYFENFIRLDVLNDLKPIWHKLHSLTIPPATLLPNNDPNSMKPYMKSIPSIIKHVDFSRIESLDIHVDPRQFLTGAVHSPLRLKHLKLNIRPDTTPKAAEELMGLDKRIEFKDLINTSTLEEIEILSWFNEQDIQVSPYEVWRLDDILEFKSLKSLLILSMPFDERFLNSCIDSFHSLQRLRLDYLFDTPVTENNLIRMCQSPWKLTLNYLDIKCATLDAPLLDIQNDETSMYKLHLSCSCDNCKDIFPNVIIKKIFPRDSCFIVKEFEDVERRNFVLQMFKLYPIIPYAVSYDRYPSVGYHSRPLKEYVMKLNFLLSQDPNWTPIENLSLKECQNMYYTYMHSLRRTFNRFLEMFLNLEYLIFNDLPTKVERLDEHQRYNVPLFFGDSYISNQVYELIQDESLFD